MAENGYRISQGYDMSEQIVYREMESGEEQAVCDLVRDVFNALVAPDYSPEGVFEFFRFADPGHMAERMGSDGFVLVAYQGDTLAGMLEFFPPDRIALLFVSVRRRGIAKGLLDRAIRKACGLNPGLSTLVVHSSPYAEAIYRKMGFQKTGDAETVKGITFIPMALRIEDTLEH